MNLFGAYEASRLVAKSMIASGARGAIVSVASEAGKKGHMESLAYSASKAALIKNQDGRWPYVSHATSVLPPQ